MKRVFLHILMGLVHLGFILFCVALLFGCNKNPKGLSVESDSFEKKSGVGLVVKKNYVVLYNKSTFQYVYNIKRKSIRIQSDDHSEYVNATFTDYPKDIPQINDIVNVEIVYKDSVSDPEVRLILSMLILKQESGKFWLWNEEEKVGLIIDRELII